MTIQPSTPSSIFSDVQLAQLARFDSAFCQVDFGDDFPDVPEVFDLSEWTILAQDAAVALTFFPDLARQRRGNKAVVARSATQGVFGVQGILEAYRVFHCQFPAPLPHFSAICLEMSEMKKFFETHANEEWEYHDSFQGSQFLIDTGVLFFHSEFSGLSVMMLKSLIEHLKDYRLPVDFQFHVFDSQNSVALYKTLFERDYWIGAGEAVWFRDGLKMSSTTVIDYSEILDRLWPQTV